MIDPSPSGDPEPGPAGSPESAETDAVRLVGRGVLAGYVLAAMNAFLAWFIYDTGYGVNEAAGEDRIIIAGSTLLMAVVAAGLAYRFGRKRSVVIPVLFLAWVCFEVVVKFLYGKPAPEYLLSVGLVGFGLISGLRGALALRKMGS